MIKPLLPCCFLSVLIALWLPGCAREPDTIDIGAFDREATARQQAAEAAVKEATGLQEPKVVDALRRLLREGDDVTRLLALRALSERGYDALPAAIDAVPLLEVSFAATSNEAQLFLTRFDDELSAVAPALLTVLKEGKFSWSREKAAGLLGNCRSAIGEVLPAFATALATEPDAGVRLRCVLSVAQLARSGAEPAACMKLLQQIGETDSDEEVRRNALGMLGGLKTATPIE